MNCEAKFISEKLIEKFRERINKEMRMFSSLNDVRSYNLIMKHVKSAKLDGDTTTHMSREIVDRVLVISTIQDGSHLLSWDDYLQFEHDLYSIEKLNILLDIENNNVIDDKLVEEFKIIDIEHKKSYSKVEEECTKNGWYMTFNSYDDFIEHINKFDGFNISRVYSSILEQQEGIDCIASLQLPIDKIIGCGSTLDIVKHVAQSMREVYMQTYLILALIELYGEDCLETYQYNNINYYKIKGKVKMRKTILEYIDRYKALMEFGGEECVNI